MSRQKGSAIVVVMIVSLLVTAAGLGALALVDVQLRAARQRVLVARSRRLARAAVRVAAQWFEARERPPVIAPPGPGEVDRERRAVDPDGDGTSVPWSAAPAPWNVRYRERAPSALFRPPDLPDADDRFLGTASAPDVALEDVRARARLDAVARVLDASGNVDVVRVAFYGPPPDAGGEALATIEVVVEQQTPGGGAVRGVARGVVRRVDWGRDDRPLVAAGDAVLRGEAEWRHGEAVIGGALDVAGATWPLWPGGLPWLGPDRPLRADVDGDGTPDDADGDGRPDWEAWNAASGTIADPWWRARVRDGWTGPAAPAGPCVTPFPFGPRAVPPVPIDKTHERSGLLVRCAADEGPPLEPRWSSLAALGVRGAWTAVEDPARPDRFRLDGQGEPRPLSELVPARGGVVRIVTDPARSSPLRLDAGGGAGAVLVDGAGLELTASACAVVDAAAPAGPADTRGASRPPRGGDDLLPLAGDEAGGWTAGEWTSGATPGAGPPSRWSADWQGLIAATGPVRVAGPLTVLGRLRSGPLELDGRTGPVRIVAGPAAGDPSMRGGPPGAPRVIVTGLRNVP